MKSRKPYLVGEFTIFRPDGTIRRVVQKSFRDGSEDALRLRVRDRSGAIVQEHVAPVRCFVKNFAVMQCTRFGNWSRSVVDESGTPTSIPCGYCKLMGGIVSSIRGLRIGTDDGTILPLAPSNYSLGAMITDGSGPGQMDYKLPSWVAVTASGDDYNVQYAKEFENLSGATIVVKEMGLTGVAFSAGFVYYMILRDLKDYSDVPFNVSVLNGNSIEARYILEITQNSGFVKNYLLALDSGFMDIARNFTDTGGSVYNAKLHNPVTNWELDPAAGEDSWGLWAGSDETALSCDSYTLGTKIPHGTNPDQLSYGAGTVDAEYVAGSDSIVKVRRTFTNDSGAAIIVRECGIVARGGTSQVMIGRVLSGTLQLEPSEAVEAKIHFIHPV